MLIKDKKYNYLIMAFLIFAGFSSLASTHIQEQEAKQDSFNFSELTCWDILLVNEEDRPTALTLVYGYQAGVKSKATHTASQIKDTLTKTGEVCESNPDMKVISAIEEATK
jgi:hypothetical protein